jgi:hypothetical protein
MITSLLMWHLPLFASWTGPLVTMRSSTPAMATAAMMPTAHSARAPVIFRADLSGSLGRDLRSSRVSWAFP